ncbi:MAG TPA: hypothetical protein VNO55_15255, partial [Polyangia bacterium]|nr:hypothetical protein [Polyangia bacterium]
SVAVAFIAVAVIVPGAANAFPWMIGHGYSGCASCHVDPSGGGLLNEFGRGEAADSLRSHYGSEPSPVQPFFGVFQNPDWLLTGGSIRYMGLFMKTDGAPLMNSLILMQADLRAGVQAGAWRAAGSLGFIQNGNSPAAVVGSLVAREYWVGYAFANDTVLLRAGRINLPFGIRSIEHTLFVRAATRTDLNDTQQHGVALAFRGGGFRGELQGVAGNYQASPDAFRERGYSGYLEWSPDSRYALGASSLITHVAQDPYFRTANTRQAHGVLMRAAPIERVVALAEADYVIQAPTGLSQWNGLATLLQLDVEPWQGLHLIGSGETYASGQPNTPTSWGIWGGVGWFFLSHADLRVDYMHRAQSYGTVRVPVDAVMAQIHLFL